MRLHASNLSAITSQLNHFGTCVASFTRLLKITALSAMLAASQQRPDVW